MPAATMKRICFALLLALLLVAPLAAQEPTPGDTPANAENACPEEREADPAAASDPVATDTLETLLSPCGGYSYRITWPGRVNVRNCASVQCALVSSYPNGALVTVKRVVAGKPVNGDPLWLMALQDERLVFIHASLAGPVAAAAPRALAENFNAHDRLEDGGFVLGLPTAPITVVAFEDYACPHCQTYEDTIQRIIETYVMTGQARFEYRFFLTVDARTGGRISKLAACVGELAEDQFWAGHRFLYQRARDGRLYDDDTARLLAAETGLDYRSLSRCLLRVRQVAIDSELAWSIGAPGTPSVALRYPDGRLLFLGGAPGYARIIAEIEKAAGDLP